MRRAVFKISDPLILPNQPLILQPLKEDALFDTCFAYWPTTEEIGRKVVVCLEKFDEESRELSEWLFRIGIERESREEEKKILSKFKLTTMVEFGLLIYIKGCGQDGEEWESSLPKISLDSLHSHLYYVLCYL